MNDNSGGKPGPDVASPMARGGKSSKFEPLKKLSLTGADSATASATAATKLDTFKDGKKTQGQGSVGGFDVLESGMKKSVKK